MYVKPLVLENGDLAEGIFAFNDSGGQKGSSPCWTLVVTSEQTDAGGYHTFRVKGTHHDVQHISTKTTVEIDFTDSVTKAEFEGFTAVANGTAHVTLTRESHANAYGSGDEFASLLKIWSPNYQAIDVSKAYIYCTYTENVQGNGGDGS